MQTRTYGDLFKLIQSLAGVTAFATNEQDDIANLINRNYQVAYDTIQMWPRYLVTGEERPLGSLIVNGITLTTAPVTVYEEADQFQGVYQNLGNDSNGNAIYFPMNFIYNVEFAIVKNNTIKRWEFLNLSELPTIDSEGVISISGVTSVQAFQDKTSSTDGTDLGDYDYPWQVKRWNTGVTYTSGYPVVEQRNIIPNDSTFFASQNLGGQVSRERIGEFIRIHRNQSFLNNSSIEYDFYADEDGANILNIANPMDGSAFITYKKKFIPFTTSSDYTTSTEEVPGEFFQFIAYAAYSDFLRMDGQHEKAQLEQENAQNYLSLELERVDVIMNQNTVNKRFSTHLNRQSR